MDLNICAYCGKPLGTFDRTVDHLIPESRGGKRSNKNKVPACLKCNQLKGDMNLGEFSRAVDGMIRLELSNHKEKMSHLKKLQNNIGKIWIWLKREG